MYYYVKYNIWIYYFYKNWIKIYFLGFIVVFFCNCLLSFGKVFCSFIVINLVFLGFLVLNFGWVFFSRFVVCDRFVKFINKLYKLWIICKVIYIDIISILVIVRYNIKRSFVIGLFIFFFFLCVSIFGVSGFFCVFFFISVGCRLFFVVFCFIFYFWCYIIVAFGCIG